MRRSISEKWYNVSSQNASIDYFVRTNLDILQPLLKEIKFSTMRLCLLSFLFLSINVLSAQMPKILDLQKRGQVKDQWLAERMETVMPELMRT